MKTDLSVRFIICLEGFWGSAGGAVSMMMNKRKYGVLVISHGSREPDWVQLVDEAVAQAAIPAGVPVFSSYLELVEGRLIQDGIDRLEADGVTDIITVPLFISSGSVHIDEIRYALGLEAQPALPTDLPRMRAEAKIHWTSVMDDHPLILEALYDKLRPLSEEPEREVLIVVGHGSREEGFYERWLAVLERAAHRLRELGGFQAAYPAMLQQEEQARELMEKVQVEHPGCQVILSPFFVSEGYFTRKVVPQRFAGFEWRYNGKTLLPHPAVSKWIAGFGID